MKKVLINKPIHSDAIALLSQEVEVITPYQAPAEEVVQMLPDMHGMILCAGMKMQAKEMEVAKNIEVIGRHGAGLDIVDVAEATQRKIPVVFTPLGPTESTAEHAFLLMMAAARKLTYLDRETRKGNFHVRDQVVGFELDNASVGVVGFGHIGERFAEMCRDALHMTVFVFDPFISRDKVENWGAIYMDNILEMAKKVDIISLHVPATAETNHLIDAKVLEALGSGGFLINASRGPVVDEKALIAALQNNTIAGAAVDVFDPEPPQADNPLFQLDSIVLTPHLASFTDQGRRRMGMMVAEDVLHVLRGEKPIYPANPELFA